MLFWCVGITVSRSDLVFTVGDNASLNCSTDLDVVSIEWLYNYQVISTSSADNALQLVFNPVNDSIHSREYTCRITSPYGVQEQTVQAFVEGNLMKSVIYKLIINSY